MSGQKTAFPKSSRTKDSVLAQMKALRTRDANWQDGKVFSLVFFAGEEASTLIKEAYTMFFSENGLNPTVFPSLRQFETDVVGMSIALLGGDADVVGNMTSGGTESILMAVVTAREWARVHKPHIKKPEILLPVSVHPAFEKAAHYFDVSVVHVPVGEDFRADVALMETAVTPNTILMVGSAPSYPHGMVDPIQELAAIAQKNDILFHVDACVGGFMLPFVQKLGYELPPFDFSVPGVTSISADLHKYGYAAKGASLILYRNREIRRHQLFAYLEWPGGIYASPTMAGTRPGGAIAAAWAIMNYLGEDGYMEIADQVMQTAVSLHNGINQIEGIHIVSNPPMSIMAIGSDELNIYEIGDEMSLRGWHLDRQQFPPTLHVTVNYAHINQADAFLRDLADSVKLAQKPSLHQIGNNLAVKVVNWAVRVLPKSWTSRMAQRASTLFDGDGGSTAERSAAMYGMLGSLPNRGDLHEVVLDLVEQFTEAEEKTAVS